MMTREQQIKDYVRYHYKYYGFYPYDVVLNMDTEQEETLTREEYMRFTIKSKPIVCQLSKWHNSSCYWISCYYNNSITNKVT